MKKKLAVGMVVLLFLSMFTGCGKTSSKYLLDVDYAEYVTLCEYKGIEAREVTFDVSESDIQERITEDTYEFITYDVITNRGAETGDYVNIDYTGSIDGEELEDYTDTEMDFLLGEEMFYPEAEEAMVGMKTGEEKTIKVKLDEKFAMNEEDAGKTLSLTMKINEISVENLPEYNETFVKENMGYDSIEAYEEAVKEELYASKQEQYQEVAIEEIMEYVLSNSVFDKYPQELYDTCKANFESMCAQYAEAYGMSVEDYYELFGLDEEGMEENVVNMVNTELVIGAIAQKEKIDCNDSEVEDYAMTYYEDYGYSSADEFKEQYGVEQIGTDVLYDKVTQFLYENAKFTTITEDEYLQEEAELYDEYYDEEEIEVDEGDDAEDIELDVEEDDAEETEASGEEGDAEENEIGEDIDAEEIELEVEE